MYVRDSEIIVLRPGQHGRDHAAERFSAGGSPENDLLPIDGEIDLHRIVLPGFLPDTVLAALAGRPVRTVVEVPTEIRGNCPLRGCDHAGDTLFRIADRLILTARRVDRGTLILVETRPDDPSGVYH